jgi:hypothetical protein
MTSDQDARSQLGTPGRIEPLPGPSRPLRRRRRPWLIALLVVLVVAAGVLTTVLVRANRQQNAGPPAAPSSRPTGSVSSSGSAPSSSGTTTAPSTSPSPIVPPLLGRGQEAPGSAIPWSQVNAGWQLALWTPVTDSARLRSVPLTLFLVNPIGGRYRIATLPAGSSVELWAPDRRHVMIGHDMQSEQSRGLSEWDLRTGRQLSNFNLGNRSLFGYADPAGQSIALFVPATAGQPGRMARFSLTGQHLQDFPLAGSAVGEIFGDVLPSGDGRLLVVKAANGLAVLRSSDAALVRQVVRPAGDQQCQLRRWWTSQSVLAYCDVLNGPINLYSIPIDGRPATVITHAQPPDRGFTNGWPISGGMLLQRAGPCGPGGQAVLSGGTVRSLTYQLPPGVAGTADASGVFDNQVNMYAGVCGSDRGSLVSLDLGTGKALALLGPGLNGGSVT